MSRPMVALFAVLAALGVAIGVAWGLQALAVYAFFAGIAAAVGIALWVGGDWLRDASGRRFRR